MVKWKKLNKKVAGVLLGVMVLFSASTTAFAYVDPSAETTNTEAAQTETVQNKETEKPADEGVLPENNKTEKKEDAFTEPGNGEVQDDIQNGSSKEFLTITTKNNNTFYLVIDRSSTSQNVYLLSQVDENDLKEFVDQEKEPATVTPTPQVVIDENASRVNSCTAHSISVDNVEALILSTVKEQRVSPHKKDRQEQPQSCRNRSGQHRKAGMEQNSRFGSCIGH